MTRSGYDFSARSPSAILAEPISSQPSSISLTSLPGGRFLCQHLRRLNSLAMDYAENKF
jgi:hypothetical protein